jgi:hypothetical protein
MVGERGLLGGSNRIPRFANQPVQTRTDVRGVRETDNAKRLDGTNKSTGFLGRLSLGDGREATELSTSFNFDGKEVFMPILVPTLTDKEVEFVLSGKKISGVTQARIERKAQDHAFSRIEKGLSPFFNEGIDNRKDFPERKKFLMQ